MNKVFWQIFITITFILTACGQSVPATQSTPTPIIDNATTTSSPIPAAAPTRTALPSATVTASVTPLPTIPTFTPTFDVSTIVTVTPAPKAECPILHVNVNISLTNFNDYYPDLITALNQGVPIQTIINVFEKAITQHYSSHFKEKIEYEVIDVTNDGVPEIILSGDQFVQPKAIILGCSEGKYKPLYTRHYEAAKYMYLLAIDANQNGVTEIIIGGENGSSIGTTFELSVIEWFSNTFHEISPNGFTIPSAFQSLRVEDLDGDKIKEIYWREGGINYSPPWRLAIGIFKWNGVEFVPLPLNYDVPEYRFQAIQDADQKTTNGEYGKAINLYQEVIFNDKLDWWSAQKREYLLEGEFTKNIDLLATPAPTLQPPLPTSIPDTTEYPRLAAYAYYRIMLIHLVQGHESDATTVYNTLQQKFGNDQYGRPYVEMATAFWNAYQSTHKMYAGCATAIQYAVEHPDILIPLGSDYHGAQSHQYKPEDVCPFR